MSKKLAAAIGRYGTVAAMVISWSMWKSFWWMLVHGLFGWFYVIYWAIQY